MRHFKKHSYSIIWIFERLYVVLIMRLLYVAFFHSFSYSFTLFKFVGRLSKSRDVYTKIQMA